METQDFLKLDLFLPDSDCSIKNKNVFGLLVFLLDIRIKKIEILGYFFYKYKLRTTNNKTLRMKYFKECPMDE